MRTRLWRPLPILAGLALAVAALVSGATPVSAHAHLAASNPAHGAALAEMPAEISFIFSEPVDEGSTRVSLSTTRPDSPAPATGDIVVDGTTVRFPVAAAHPEPLTVTVAWRVVSATDGHETTGLLIFSVGTGIPPRIDAASSTENPSWRSVALRGVGLLGLAFQAASIAGGWLGGVHPKRRLALGGSTLTAIGFAADAVDRNLLDRQAGLLLLSAAAMGAVAAAAVIVRRPAAAAVPWLLAVAAVVAGGHAAGDADRLIATLIGTIHAAIGLAWAGLIIALALTSRTGDPANALRRIGPLALVGVLALAAAGIALTALRVDGLRSLGDVTYGRLVIAKQALLAAAVATAAVNRLVVLPRLPDRRWAAITTPVLAFEALILAGAVAVAGALSSTPPADGPRAVPVATRAIPISEETPAGDFLVRLTSSITGAEDDELLVTVSAPSGRAVGEIQRLIVASSVTRPGEDSPTAVSRTDATPRATSTAEATFALTAMGLAVGGVWSLEITVRRAGLDDAVGEVAIDTSGWAFQSPRLVRDAWRWPRVPPAAPVLLATAAIVIAVGARGVRRSRTIEPLPAVIILAAVVAIAAGFTVQAIQQIAPAPAGNDATQPDGELDLIAAAGDYRTYCLACHGVDGGGVDDSDPLHDHGSGTDLLDADTRDRPDGDLFGLISSGVAARTMPAYDVALTEEERWAMVAYLRNVQAGEGLDVGESPP